MIECVRLLRGIGKFDDTTAANITLNRYTLVYAENGRGKTMLTAILRSFSTGDAVYISERRRLTTQHAPHAALSCTGGPPDAVFMNGAWNRTLPDVVIFDDRFVDENVHSGLAIRGGRGPGQPQQDATRGSTRRLDQAGIEEDAGEVRIEITGEQYARIRA